MTCGTRPQAKAASEGTTVSERVRAGLREHIFTDSLAYLVPGVLGDLKGPASGTVQLPIHVDWGPDRAYDVADDGSCAGLYQLTLQNSGSADEMGGIGNAGRLLALWPSMRLPDGCRHFWEAAFPQLPQHRESREHPSWAALTAQQPIAS